MTPAERTVDEHGAVPEQAAPQAGGAPVPTPATSADPATDPTAESAEAPQVDETEGAEAAPASGSRANAGDRAYARTLFAELAESEPGSARPMRFDITVSSVWAKGRAEMTFSCARRSFAADTIFMALVIWRVFFTDLMRLRMSRSEAMAGAP